MTDTFTAASATYEGNSYAPRVTLTRDDGGSFDCVIEIEGLEPARAITTEERRLGIVSLDPPTLRIQAVRSRYQTHRNLIAAGCRAVIASVESTTGDAGGIGEIAMAYMRTAWAIRSALRLLDEEI